MQVTVLFTCFNRKDQTVSCIETLTSGNSQIQFDFVVVDDNSTDGTVEALQDLSDRIEIEIIKGSGGLFYSGGMRLGMDYILKRTRSANYLLLVNDDVVFFDNCIEKLIARSRERQDAVVAGATCDDKGNLSYGAIRYIGKSIKYQKVVPSPESGECDTFNANCVLIPYQIFQKTGNMDKHYIHSLGDFDYGLQMKRNGVRLCSSEEYVGMCLGNSPRGTWLDSKLPIPRRLRLKEQPKGAPFKCWFYFLFKNFGLGKAVFYGLTPYVRILLRR